MFLSICSSDVKGKRTFHCNIYEITKNQLLQATAIADLLRERSELAASEAWNTMIELEKEVDIYHQHQFEY